MKKQLLRQGDVLLLPLAKVPKAATRRTPADGRYILAYGEATGHHHAIAARPGVTLLDVPRDGAVEAKTFLTVEDAVASLTHQEHATLAVPTGTYRVIVQKQYQRKAIQRVVD
jgi:hypothetical protein